MKYSLFFYHQDGEEAGLTEADMAPWQAAFVDYTNALNEAGVSSRWTRSSRRRRPRPSR